MSFPVKLLTHVLLVSSSVTVIHCVIKSHSKQLTFSVPGS